MYIKGLLFIGILLTACSGCQRNQENTAHTISSLDKCKSLISSITIDQAYPACVEEAEHGSIEAQLILADAFAAGKLGEDKVYLALAWYKESARRSQLAQIKLAQFYITVGERDKGLSVLKTAAGQGNTEAQVLLGTFYYQGKHVLHNIEKARYWLEKASECGHLGAHYMLSFIYGAPPFCNDQKSEAHLYEAARGGEVRAIEKIGDKQIGYNNYTSASQWFVQASKLGSQYAQYMLAQLIIDKKIALKIDAIALLERSQPYVFSNILLAQCYLQGELVSKDIRKAQALLKLASEQDLPEANYKIATLYLNPRYKEIQSDKTAEYYLNRSAQTNYAPAVDLLTRLVLDGKYIVTDNAVVMNGLGKLAVQGDPQAQYQLARILKSYGVPNHDKVALYWLTKSVQSNYHKAVYLLAKFYEEGIGTAIDHQQAFALYQEAAALGEANAYLSLARLYYNGQGVAKNKETAKQWLIKAAQNDVAGTSLLLDNVLRNNTNGQYAQHLKQNILAAGTEESMLSATYVLGKRYFEGVDGFTLDKDEGFFLITKAARNSYLLAQRELGIIFENGLYGTSDIPRAFYWYEKAARQGDSFAQFRLAELHFKQSNETSNIQAYVWATLAADAGLAPAQSFADHIFSFMTEEEHTKAENLKSKIISIDETSEEISQLKAVNIKIPFEVIHAVN